MSNSVHIPDSVKEIKQAISRRITILAEWQAMLAKTRKASLHSSRQLQVDATKKQIDELRQALKVAQTKAEIEKAQAFVKRLAGVRKDWENGLFDWKKVEKKPWHKLTFKIELQDKMKESERIEFIANAVANATKKVAPEFQGLLDDLKSEKMAEDFVLENGLLPVSDDEVKEEFVSLDAVEADKDDIDENDEEQTDMDCVSGSFADIFDKIEDWFSN